MIRRISGFVALIALATSSIGRAELPLPKASAIREYRDRDSVKIEIAGNGDLRWSKDDRSVSGTTL